MMKYAGVLVVLCGVLAIDAVPLQGCTDGVVFIADDQDLCRFHWCIGTVDGPIEQRCAPGARVPTWFVTSPNDQETPCTLDHSTDLSCLRCDFNDIRQPEDPDNCNPNPCAPECTCQDLWQTFHCLCPGDVVPRFETVTSGAFFCNPNPCRNGANCFSQWDTYWCECPRGYTGKNCEVPFCDPNPCMNGGTCTIDDTNYRCDCARCFGGSCCEDRIADGPQCERSIVPPPTVPTPATRTRPPTTRTTRATTTRRPVCNACQFGANCQFTRAEQCSCNPCSAGQICYDRSAPNSRECLGKPGPYGSQYTLTFSQDANVGSQYKRVYVNIGGGDLVGSSRRVRIYTPGIVRGQPCYVDMAVTISLNRPTFYDVPAECLNTESGQAESNKILRVVDLQGREIVVTVSNRDGDGYLAIPDEYAGQYFVSHSYERSGREQYITIVALNDGTTVRIQRQAEEVFIGAPTPSGVESYTLGSLQSLRITSSKLAGSVIVANRNIHVWSGNMDENSQKTQEQLPAVNRWGAGSNQYRYIIVSPGPRNINAFDDVHVQSALETDYTLVRITSSGQRVTVATNGRLPANTDTFIGSLRAGETFELTTSQPVQVTHSLRARATNGQNFYSAYALIPPVQLYAESYSFQTHGVRNGVGHDDFMNFVTLVSMRRLLADAPDYFEDLVIYHFNTVTGVNTTFTPEQLGAVWVRGDDLYWVATLSLPSEGIYYISNPSLDNYRFGAVYYGLSVTGGVSYGLPNTAFPLGYVLNTNNNIPTPTICPRCMAGPSCRTAIINSCACNPCDNFDDQCTASTDPRVARTCVGTEDNTGNPFTLMFMQNRPDNTPKRELELYVTSAGAGSRPVRIFTPYLAPSNPCYLDMNRVIAGFDVSLFTIPNAECFETIGSGVFTDKAIRVMSGDGGDLLVYAINRDEFSADGWIAFPDSAAGTDYYVVSHNPPFYGSEFAVINIQNEPVTITITYTGQVRTNLEGTVFQLPAGHVLQIQSTNDDLSGTRVQSSLPVNVYSGNIRALVRDVEDPAIGDIDSGSRDHIVEQLVSVDKWGKLFHIEPIPGRVFGDQLKIVAQADNTIANLFRRHPNGTVTQETIRMNRGEAFTRDVISDNTYRLTSSAKIQVMQITKSQERGSNIHDPSLITVPPVEQYANRYIFNTPQFSGGAGGQKRPYQFRRLLISARDEDRSGIRIIFRGTSTSVSSLGTWIPVPGSNYFNIAVDLQDGTSLILHDDINVAFMCIFYGYDDRESLGFPIGLKLQIIED